MTIGVTGGVLDRCAVPTALGIFVCSVPKAHPSTALRAGVLG